MPLLRRMCVKPLWCSSLEIALPRWAFATKFFFFEISDFCYNRPTAIAFPEMRSSRLFSNEIIFFSSQHFILKAKFSEVGPHPWSRGPGLNWGPGLVVVGRDSRSEGQGFEFQHRILDWHFFTLTCKNCNVCLEKMEKKQKETGDGPFT